MRRLPFAKAFLIIQGYLRKDKLCIYLYKSGYNRHQLIFTERFFKENNFFAFLNWFVYLVVNLSNMAGVF